jgi:hypothetical protein
MITDTGRLLRDGGSVHPPVRDRNELPGEPDCGAVHVSVRYDLVYQADPQGFLSVHEPFAAPSI